ncbi:MAG: hypothetical protein HC826_02115 [Rhodospirillales bacterium]|nr:hypothetical protein [Rhodospirillales bacterium]
MLRALPEDEAAPSSALRDFLQRIAQRPRRWHYALLIVGLALVITGGLVSTWASLPP